MSKRLLGILVLAAAAVVATLALSGIASAGHGHGHNAVAKVLVEDDCEPASFDAVLGHGTCVGHGHTTFDAFIAQLIALQDAPAWRFNPSAVSLPAGGQIKAVNVGGEFHTFTEVEAFGGGCVDELNEILGLEPVPECDDPSLFGTTGLVPGQRLKTEPLAPGTHLFLCLIHPWMRTTATVG
jgi:plastocyanin